MMNTEIQKIVSLGLPADVEADILINRIQTEESNQKRREKLIGRQFSAETLVKMQIAAANKAPVSDETKAKIKYKRQFQVTTLESVQKRVKAIEKKPLLTCQYCGQNFKYQKRLENHMQKCKKTSKIKICQNDIQLK